MTVPPDEGRDPNAPWSGTSGPSGQSGPADPQPPLDFDPYRFGRPEHPVAPEYAPPGYRPPPSAAMPQYPYTPSPPPPAGYAMYGPRRASNTKATVALVLGIVAILLFWTTILDVVFVVPAIVLGALGRRDAKRYPERGGRGAATSGLVCGIVAALLAIVAGVYVYDRIKPCVDKYRNHPTSSAYQKCATDRLLGDGK